MRYKAVLFDLDGTLLDSVHIILKSNKETCEAMGIHYDEALWRSWIGIPLEVQARRLSKTRHREYIDTYKQVYRNYQDKDLRLFPGTLEMLDKLKERGYLTALVTSKAARGTNRVLGLSGLDGKFDLVLTCDDVENPKPHPEPVLKALELLEVKPEEAFYVGDAFFDLETARGAGIEMVGVSWGARTKDELLSKGAIVVVDSWDEFLTWLSKHDDSQPLPSPPTPCV